MDKILICTAHGLGDNLLGFSCAEAIRNNFYSVSFWQPRIEILSFSRDEVFEPLRILFGFNFNLKQDHKKEYWGENNRFINDLSYYNELKQEYDEVYYVLPDLLFNHPLSFPWVKYNTHPETIRNSKILTQRWKPTNQIFCSLNTSTSGYEYLYIRELLIFLGNSILDYEIVFPYLREWNGYDLDELDLSNLPENVKVLYNPTWQQSLDELIKSQYCITLDNGLFHVAHHLGMPYTLLDPWWLDKPSYAHWARWRYSMDYSISVKTELEIISKIVETNVKIPQTCLLPRRTIDDLYKFNPYWRNILNFKY